MYMCIHVCVCVCVCVCVLYTHTHTHTHTHQVSDNAFGAFIHVGLQSGVVSALVNCGPMVLVSLLIQVSKFRIGI